jgi:formamidopyrimidine-DNA glycosylase
MPELAEVEAARRALERALLGRIISSAECSPDEIVLQGAAPEEVQNRLVGARVQAIGRKGKAFWIELEGRGAVCLHLGMSGSILTDVGGIRAAVNYRQNKGGGFLPDGRPKHLKLLIEAEGVMAAMVDPRRLARIWTGDDPLRNPFVASLGPDAWSDLPSAEVLARMLARRKAPIKAVLLDQAFLSGIGNWLADEILYQARIAPARPASSLAEKEITVLRGAIRSILDLACSVEADHERFPADWLFHSRWGGAKGSEWHEGRRIVREKIGGRTTAWAPDWQS